jgi:hypothetical protein
VSFQYRACPRLLSMAHNFAVQTIALDANGYPFRRFDPVYASSHEEAILKSIRPSEDPALFVARLMSDSESAWRS